MAQSATKKKPSKNGKPRVPLSQFRAVSITPRRDIAARYDAAQDSDWMKNYWANADSLDADSANSIAVREKLVKRSRYEVANNGFADGMVQTHANYLVGTGPNLRMQSNIEGFDQAVEITWRRWAKAVHLRRKLWAMAHARVQDGEAFGVVRENAKVRHRVKMDVVLFETEQCQSPYMPFATEGYIDGIRFDDFGNPVWYDVLPYHPGSEWNGYNQQPEKVPAKWILHWFTLRRPGAHRGVPEFRSTLNTGAASRRWREATIASAETAASYSALLKTLMTPDDGADAAQPFSEIEITKGMMAALPMGWDLQQLRAEHPNAQYEAFLRSQINEQARPKNMPYNLAACDSSSYNYASGRLDHQTYFGTLDIERSDADDLVLDPLFDRWWELAVAEYGWNADPNDPPDHVWDWPRHPVADIQAEANATDTRLRNGMACPTQIYAEAGMDFEDQLVTMANDYGVTPDQMRTILLQACLAPKSGGTLPATQDTDTGTDDEQAE